MLVPIVVAQPEVPSEAIGLLAPQVEVDRPDILQETANPHDHLEALEESQLGAILGRLEGLPGEEVAAKAEEEAEIAPQEAKLPTGLLINQRAITG